MNNIIKYIEENIDTINHDKDILEKDIVKLKEKLKEYDLKKQRLNSLEYELERDKYIKRFPFKVFKKLVEEIYSEVNDSEYHIYNCDIKRYILLDSIKEPISSIYRSDISYIYLAKNEISEIAEQEVLKNTFAKGKSKLKNNEFDDELIEYHRYNTDNDTRYNAVHKIIDKNYNNLFKDGKNYIGLGFYKLKEDLCDSFYERDGNDINKKNINLSLHPEALYMRDGYYMDEDYDIVLIFDGKYKILEEIKNAIILFQKNKLEDNFMYFIPKYKDGLITIDEYKNLEEYERKEIKRYVKKILK